MRIALVAALILGSSVFASGVTPRPITERAKMADRVVVAQVLSTRTELINGDVRRMVTYTDVLVGDVVKGPSGPGLDRITITQLGGRHGLWEAHVPGDATFAPGETALLLLKCSTGPNRCGLVALSEGKVKLIGSDAFVYDLSTKQHTKRPVAELLTELRAAVASQQPTPTQPAGVTR